MGLTDSERKAMVEYKLSKANRTFEQAKGNVPLMFWEVIANRLYYSAYYAVSALLLANGISAQTHNGVIQMFSLHFVKTKIVPDEFGKLYSKLFTLRLTGDYNDSYSLTESDVLPLVAPTEEFISVIGRMATNNS
ncbi:MAG: HEPN domain-containing protein [Bacteroidales bacterium]|nr:HEPN domain-containing protein [Bacteroidales bacterium]